MATERLTMRRIREILRHKRVLGRSHRDVAASLSVSVGALSAAEQRARRAGLDWASVESLSDEALEVAVQLLDPAVEIGDRVARLEWPGSLGKRLRHSRTGWVG